MINFPDWNLVLTPELTFEYQEQSENLNVKLISCNNIAFMVSVMVRVHAMYCKVHHIKSRSQIQAKLTI